MEVPKKKGKVKVCVDFRDLNKASPKDNFSLPHIDILVDNIANNLNISLWMDFLGIIKLVWWRIIIIKKTIFIMYWETFCYKVMLFGLKSMSNIETSNDKSVS